MIQSHMAVSSIMPEKVQIVVFAYGVSQNIQLSMKSWSSLMRWNLMPLLHSEALKLGLEDVIKGYSL
ncbi:hypothetical protein L1987_18265 [Smallanthus sonchifolius]|uniref:Uncharacterized protein n=1 Tax=Smallanthus sonchifolius TaxID=185202 RepID=A0ACB9IZS3_9ASTR|nr:hypothetical protein L1987_18265 [Smallanthus sonchifolius]